MPSPKFGACFALALVPLFAAAQTPAPGLVRDEAGLFGKDAVKSAEEQLDRLRTVYKRHVTIETVKKGPTANPAKWAEERATKLNLEGVYVVISLDPKHLEVAVDAKTRKSNLFTHDNASELAKLMVSQLREGKKDEALTKGSEYVADSFRTNADRILGVRPKAALLPETPAK